MPDDLRPGQSRATESTSSQRAENGGVLYSSDPRDVGWVRENIRCQTACPADTNIPAYIQAIIEGQYGSSYEINRETNVLPGILAHIYSRPCEDICRYGWTDNVSSGTQPSHAMLVCLSQATGSRS